MKQSDQSTNIPSWDRGLLLCRRSSVTPSPRCRGQANHRIAQRTTIFSPRNHEISPLLEQVPSAVSSLNLVSDRVGKAHLDDLPRGGCPFRSPVAKRRSETMNRDVGDAHAI